MPRLRRRMGLDLELPPGPPALLQRGTTSSHPHPEPLRGPPFVCVARVREAEDHHVRKTKV
ncbi:hypothetical protein BN126390023 [Stenotrophomonas indicatrix]|nr:hypothetical protein BN126390023 [Stenotrophomonas indicatrix]